MSITYLTTDTDLRGNNGFARLARRRGQSQRVIDNGVVAVCACCAYLQESEVAHTVVERQDARSHDPLRFILITTFTG